MLEERYIAVIYYKISWLVIIICITLTIYKVLKGISYLQ
jgi:hypothetical protein